MDFKEALEIVLDLASQGMLEAKDAIDSDLIAEAARQEEAIEIVRQWTTTLLD